MDLSFVLIEKLIERIKLDENALARYIEICIRRNIQFVSIVVASINISLNKVCIWIGQQR